MQDKRIGVRLSKETRKALEKEAKKMKWSLSAQVRHILTQWAGKQ